MMETPTKSISNRQIWPKELDRKHIKRQRKPCIPTHAGLLLLTPLQLELAVSTRATTAQVNLHARYVTGESSNAK